ncbi:hypothetical protein GCM10011416_14870 [Polaribacter pacificus]|uniref:Uncharacterized protein n=1 Tax=Polaribacter pacificus TaxID=1775173 RepID=A0A917HYA9_9FLAO|nr:hypothetical protein [Polaribacter pacificus]GGG97854.1 hypothetical protein GCM10011416_14870 [Polaribacter pacificus]
MDFENIKRKMDAQNMDEGRIPKTVKEIETSKMPIQRVRQSMRNEMMTQLVIIVLFFAAPYYIEMHQLAQSIYYILMFVVCLITLTYVAKMTWFLNKTTSINNNSTATVMDFIYDLKLTLEVYKTAIISGSLLLPLTLLTVYFGRLKMDEELFTNLILLDVPITTLLLYIFGYLAIAILIYLMTVSWSNKLYGVHIKNLELTLDSLKA